MSNDAPDTPRKPHEAAQPHGNPNARAGKAPGGQEGGAPNRPHESKLPRSKRTGATCRNCARSGRPCRHHGGGSTGPTTPEGKRAARGNAEKHGLRSDPKRYAQDMSDDLRLRYEELVATIATAEGVAQDPLRLAIVRDFVVLEMMAEGARAWLFKRGFLTVEGWRSVSLQGELVNETDVHGERIPEPVVPQHLVEYVGKIAKWKARLHDALRQGTGKDGDGGKLTVAQESRAQLRALFGDDKEGAA